MPRTFAIGDVHGDLASLDLLICALPDIATDDTIVFVGDYVDRGADSAGVVARVRELQDKAPCKVVALRGNHEDAWLRVIDEGWPEFVLPTGNGCLEARRSFRGEPTPADGEGVRPDEVDDLFSGAFFPVGVVEWLRSLPYFYEDEHAIYVHAGLMRGADGAFVHPSKVENKTALLWCRDKDFFRNYAGKLVVFGHTSTGQLPKELSTYTPDDPLDMWAGPAAIGLDTGCGKGGFLTCVELPSRAVHTSPRPEPKPKSPA